MPGGYAFFYERFVGTAGELLGRFFWGSPHFGPLSGTSCWGGSINPRQPHTLSTRVWPRRKHAKSVSEHKWLSNHGSISLDWVQLDGNDCVGAPFRAGSSR